MITNMNPLADRVFSVESELAQLQATARRLSETVSGLKKEVMKEEVVEAPAPTFSPQTSPPPLPKEFPAAIVNEPTQIKIEEIEIKVPKPGKTKEEAAGLEMHLGRVWSVRLGIVLLTTGFVFLSRYTYDSFIRDLGPGVRLTMMYLLSFLLTGAGLFCERWKENLKNYGRIVAAGGLAAFYYCGFAAHNVEALKVIDSPVIASTVLTISAGIFCAISLWRESRVMLSTSLALAFYSVSVNPIGWMACLSSVILAAFGVAMMIRHRWMEVGFLVLIGSYVSFTWWQFAIAQNTGEPTHWFLVGYWLLLTIAAWVPQREMDDDSHVLFTGINNSAFFLLFSSRPLIGQWMDQHWIFCFVFGGTLLAISALSKNNYPDRSRVVHLVKGIGLVTLGLALLLDGHHLFVALLIEALVLMGANLKRPHILTKSTSWIVGSLSCLTLSSANITAVHPLIWLFGALAWLALGNIHRWVERKDREEMFHPGGFAASMVALFIIVFGLMGTWEKTDLSLTMALVGLLSTGLFLLKQSRTHFFDSLSIFSVAGFISLVYLLIGPASLNFYLLGATIALLSSIPPAFACRKIEQKEISEGFHLYSGGFLALALAFIWQALTLSDLPELVILTIILAIPIVGTVVARFTGLLAHILVPFLMYLGLLKLLPTSDEALLLGFFMTAGHFVLAKYSRELKQDQIIESFLFVFAALFWGAFLSRLSSPALPMTVSAITLLITAPYFGKNLVTPVAASYYLLGIFAAFWTGSSFEIYLCLALALILHLTRTFKESDDKLQWLAIPSLLALWAQITIDADPLPYAAIWAATGTILLVTGLFLKSRCFRLIGLIILAVSLGHLMLFDLIKLNPLPRILSFMTLGAGLLGLGFVYNRWQDRLKQIL